MKLFVVGIFLIGFVAAQVPVGGVRDVRCPVNEDPKKPTQLPHNSDCGKFLKCNRGNVIALSCPAGLHWNEVRQNCDTVANAKCSKENSMQWQRPNIPPSRPTIEHPDFLNCPDVDRPGRTIVYYPYHLNCSQFYQCVNGRAVLLRCPAGYSWDIRENHCDLTHNVMCAVPRRPIF